MPLLPRDLEVAQTDPDADAGELQWSPRLWLVFAGVWSLVALAFFLSWLPEAADTTVPWPSAALWYGLTYVLWFLATPLVFFLARRFPIQGGPGGRNLPAHFAAATVLSGAHVTVFLLAYRWLDPNFTLRYPSLGVAFRDAGLFRLTSGMITYGVILFALSLDGAYRRVRLQERRAGALRRQLAEAELRALRMQIQPHFLFNTLHSISALIYESPPEALRMVSRLGDFLRATLDRDTVQAVRLEDELRFAELYLEIEKVRFGDRLTVRVEAAAETLGVRAPTLILQPLIENAIRHGVAPALGPVDLTLTAALREGGLEISLTNLEPGADRTFAKAKAGEGLGLANTRARLKRAYGDRATLTCRAGAPGAFEAILRLPIEGLDDAAA